MLRLLRPDHVNLASHLHAVVQGVDRVATMVFRTTVKKFTLVDGSTIESAWKVLAWQEMVMAVLTANP